MVVLDAGFNRRAYRKLLRVPLGFYEPLVLLLCAAPGWADIDLDYGPRHKSTRLVHDLQVLDDSPQQIASLPRCAQLVPLDTPARLLGCLYVIEGATLGGRIITRHLQAHFGITPASGAVLFDGYGATTGSHWKAFCAVVTDHADRVATAADRQQMVQSAVQTLDSLQRWMVASKAPLDRQTACAEAASTQ
jgi:heme oxygenase